MNAELMIFVLIFILVIFFILLFSFKLTKPLFSRLGKSVKELEKESEFVEKSKDKIDARIESNASELKKLRIPAMVTFILFLLSLVSFMIIDNIIISIAICIITTIVFGIFYVKYSNLNDEKYDKVVEDLLKEYDKDLIYYPHDGFTREEYYTCLFPETCDRFNSEDMITNIEKGFCYSDILVESESKDDDGHSHYTTEFQGALARIEIKDIKCRIFLGSTAGRFIFGKNNYGRIKFENDEFNDLFQAGSDNELLAYKLLTPDIMEEFVNIKKNTYGDIDIRILNDKLYIRFVCGDTFDSRAFSKNKEKENLVQSIAILEEVMKTMDKVKNIIEKKNVD